MSTEKFESIIEILESKTEHLEQVNSKHLSPVI